MFGESVFGDSFVYVSRNASKVTTHHAPLTTLAVSVCIVLASSAVASAQPAYNPIIASPFARPALSTVSLDVDAIARAVGDFFKAREGGARPGKRRVIPANLVLRQSA